jgi:hypothetical protein
MVAGLVGLIDIEKILSPIVAGLLRVTSNARNATLFSTGLKGETPRVRRTAHRASDVLALACSPSGSINSFHSLRFDHRDSCWTNEELNKISRGTRRFRIRADASGKLGIT